MLCQAVDLRALQDQFQTGVIGIVGEELKKHFGDHLSAEDITTLQRTLAGVIHSTLETTSTMDAVPRLQSVAASTSTPIMDFFATKSDISSSVYPTIATFRAQIASRSSALLEQLRYQFISGEKGPTPASSYLGKTRGLYEFVRSKLGVKMHGMENLTLFEDGINETEMTIGQNISLIYEVRFSLVFAYLTLSDIPISPSVMARCRASLSVSSSRRTSIGRTLCFYLVSPLVFDASVSICCLLSNAI